MLNEQIINILVYNFYKYNKRFIVALIAILILFVPSQASAAAYTWYQAGQGGGPGAGYLANPGSNSWGLAHMLDNAITSDVEYATVPGEYCNATHTGTEVRYQNSYDQSSYTGFNPGQPWSSWQEGDAGSNNVCQANGNTWGLKLSGASNNNCTGTFAPCVMHKFVRLSNGDDNRPWSSTFGNGARAALSIDTKVLLKTANNVNGGAFGYVCPIIKDVANPTSYIEYCLINWKMGSGFPNITQFDSIAPNNGSCQPTGNNNVDIVFTTFQADLNWATMRPGSSSFFSDPTLDSVYQTASISRKNLENVITRVQSPSPTGCGRQHSSNLDDYALVGYEIGVDGGNIGMLGEKVHEELLRTTTDTLYPGDKLLSGQYMDDSTGTYRITMQGDGNLVTRNIQTGALVWYSNTFWGPGGAYAQMGGDGNFVVYKPDGTPLGYTNTFGNNGAYAILQPDGNFVIYKGTSYKWASSQHSPYGF